MTGLVLLALDAAPLVAQVVTIVIGFFITLYILYLFAWGPIVKTIDERRDLIAKEFDSIEEKQAHLESQIRDYEERLRQIDQEARERMNKAIDEGKRSANEIMEEARQSAEAMRAKAESDIRLEVEKARVDLRDEMVRLTLGATEKLLRTKLDEAAHRELVGNFIAEMETRSPS